MDRQGKARRVEDRGDSSTLRIRSVAAESIAPKTESEAESEPFTLRSPSTPLSLENLEREHIFATITWASGNKTLAARVLGINRRTLFRKLAKYKGKV